MKIQTGHVFNKKPVNPNVNIERVNEKMRNVAETLKKQLNVAKTEIPDSQKTLDITA